MSEYKKNSLSLAGTVSLGTGVMIGAAIFCESKVYLAINIFHMVNN